VKKVVVIGWVNTVRMLRQRSNIFFVFVFPLLIILLLGTMFGGWRIVKTMGQKVAKLKPVDGFCAESSAALTLAISSAFGIPVSTTHTITGAIMGIGSLRRLSAVRWGVAGRIVWAWVLTIPAAAAKSALAYALAGRFFPGLP
jgi:PiT family inorganic phosphate transporter